MSILKSYREQLKTAEIPVRKTLRKLGTVKISAVEATPVVWKDKLLRFEWSRNSEWGKPGGVVRKTGCYYLIDMETEEIVSEFAEGHAFGCCYTENEKMYVHGVKGNGGGNVISTFVSSDLQSWEQSTALVLPEQIQIYNTSVCKAGDRYVMAIEIGGNDPAVGRPYTCVFAESKDLVHWNMLDMMEYSYCRDRYTACPCLRYYDGYFYIICLESAPFHRWIPYIARSHDLRDFELGVINPVMWFDNDDKKVIHPERFTKEQLEYLSKAVNCNNSDFDMCDYQGKVVITYSWGNQYGKEFLALAEYDGTQEEFVKSFFAD
ncbi:MAG: hypothetical protein IJY22_05680 [Clostridia bacterium]|nr:hypothetical protein [Clostridia bacterium]